jgi:uncharacterized protein
MDFADPPRAAAWQHVDARTGFEVAYFDAADDGWRIHGCTTAVEDGVAWVVEYEIELDDRWATRSAHISARTATGHRTTSLAADTDGRWRIDGRAAPHLDGCRDVDLESSAMTNAFPVHRLQLAVGARADAPAAYVRAADLTVERLDQTYERVADDAGQQRFEYAAPVFDVNCRLVYDQSGLVIDYPGIALRVT